MEQIEGIVSDVDKFINKNALKEIRSEVIGEMVIERLQKIDEVAYVRFASVYRQFKDINQFMDEMQSLLKKKGK
jgi:transcriptional repressor NrdR